MNQYKQSVYGEQILEAFAEELETEIHDRLANAKISISSWSAQDLLSGLYTPETPEDLKVIAKMSILKEVLDEMNYRNIIELLAYVAAENHLTLNEGDYILISRKNKFEHLLTKEITQALAEATKVLPFITKAI